MRWIKEAVALYIHLSNLAAFFVHWSSNKLTKLLRNARRARRGHRRWLSAEAWRAYLDALSAKGLAIRKAKGAHFKQAVADAA